MDFMEYECTNEQIAQQEHKDHKRKRFKGLYYFFFTPKTFYQTYCVHSKRHYYKHL